VDFAAVLDQTASCLDGGLFCWVPRDMGRSIEAEADMPVHGWRWNIRNENFWRDGWRRQLSRMVSLGSRYNKLEYVKVRGCVMSSKCHCTSLAKLPPAVAKKVANDGPWHIGANRIYKIEMIPATVETPWSAFQQEPLLRRSWLSIPNR
jgi:hypothetical protein